MPATDVELLQKWFDHKDASAFEEITRRYAGFVFSTARRILGNDTEAQDIAQECFVRLAAADTNVARHLGGWLHRVATNHSITKLRGDKRRQARETAYVREHSATDSVSWDDLQEVVDDAINRLDIESRELVVAYFLEKRTQESLAGEFNVTRQTINHRIGKGVAQIRDYLKQKGVTISAVVFETLLLSRPADAAPAALAVNLARFAIAGGNITPVAAGLSLYGWIAAAVFAVLVAGVLLYATTARRSTPNAETEP